MFGSHLGWGFPKLKINANTRVFTFRHKFIDPNLTFVNVALNMKHIFKLINIATILLQN